MKKYNIFIAIIFAGAILLRTGLALYNRESNDPHMPVVRFIMRNEKLPEKVDCWECFQPKLFHYTAAKLLEYLHLEKGDDADAQKVIVQLLNVFAGTVVLVITWMFVSSQQLIRDEVKLLGFAFLALNPQLTGINSQVTNDSFVIMFCVLAVYFAYLVLKYHRDLYYFFVVFFSVLAVLVKTNAWVSVVAIAISFFIEASLSDTGRFKKFVYVVAYPLLVACFAMLSPFSQYVDNYQKYGFPILLNINKQTAPFVVEETYIPYAGILSVQDGFFTFKLKDLLENPVTQLADRVVDTSHRTSFWTRLYGSAVSVHYENYPPSWRLKDRTSFVIYRGIYILALLPLVALLIGVVGDTSKTIKGFLRKDKGLLESVSYGLFALLFAGYILFAALYAFQYRTYNVIKAVFVYPGLLAYVYLCMQSLNRLFSNLNFLGTIKLVFGALMALLLVFFVMDVLVLYLQLLPNRSGWEIVLDRLSRAWR